MQLDSVVFLSLFLPLVALLNALLRQTRAKNRLLLAAGLVFYAFGGLAGLLLMLALAAVNYGLGALLCRREGSGRAIAAAAIVIDLAALVAFKYLDALLPAYQSALPGFRLAAPLGISFFTFKCISYIADVRRDREHRAGSFFAFLLYVSFFPQITAGPIARFRDFQPQLEERVCTPAFAARGLERYIVGLAKKLILAGAAARLADPFFAAGAALDARSAWLAAIAFPLQIYFDFSGYSDMAIGLGNLFGFQTAENFDRPYLAASVTEFWRRWHISLSGWFRDYVYIPLGGSRRGRGRAAVNKLIVFALSGLWHGGAWTFLLWGLWHGLFAALEGLRVIDPKKLRGSRGISALGHIYALCVVCFGFILFRADSPAGAWRVFSAMFGASGVTAASTTVLLRALSPVNGALLVLGAALIPLEARLPSAALSAKGDAAPRPLGLALCFLLLLACILALSAGGFAPFIYAQF